VGSAAFGVLTVDLDFRPPAKELLKDIKSILANVELLVFFIVIFCSGLFWGYIESYLFWFLEEMGGSKSLMGLTVTVSSLFGIPALILSDVIFRRIGHPNVQIIGFAFYVVRLIGNNVRQGNLID
jgi:Na+/melibiose symporter-like transporter